MTKQSRSKVNGELKDAETAHQKGMQSSNVGLTPLARSPLMSATLDSIAPQSPTFQPTPNSQEIPPNVTWGKIIQVFAHKLVELGALEWRSWELADGRKGWGLFFDNQKWLVDPMTKELTPANTEAK